MKPSEENSIVPKMLRDKFRQYKERKREEEIERQRGNTPAQKPSSASESKALKDLIDNDTMPENEYENRRREMMEEISQSNADADQSAYRKFAKGGMVKKAKTRSHRGDGVCQKGFTKGRMY